MNTKFSKLSNVQYSSLRLLLSVILILVYLVTAYELILTFINPVHIITLTCWFFGGCLGVLGFYAFFPKRGR